ncbi:hypothetical protein SAMN05421507_102196 [Lentzea jiangxiensis]|uniref:Uncharacterized protein n=1 Tax=Lentzea jiangxiensis TaxID=641025 RepID=A0A1H0IR02_9PSEU|nr:hypothetical protein SAMN05421507_102196 [Lentzea jiangxiensis]
MGPGGAGDLTNTGSLPLSVPRADGRALNFVLRGRHADGGWGWRTDGGRELITTSLPR